MKKRYKIGLITTITGVVIAAVGVIGIYANPSLNQKALEKYKEKNKIESFESVYTKDEFKNVKKVNISFDLWKDSVIIKKSDTNEAKISSENVYIDNYECYIDNDTLIISENSSEKIYYEFSTLGFGLTLKRSVTIELPEAEYDELSVIVDSSDVEISDINADLVNLENGVGNIDISNLTSDNTVDITADVGDVTISDSDIYNLISKLDIGDCNIKNSKFDMGNIFSDTGDIDIIDSKFISDGDEEKLELYSNAGDIEIENSEIQCSSKISTDVGNINLNIVGDIENYTITITVNVGDYSINEEDISHYIGSDSKYTMELLSDFGDIDVEVNE